MTKKLFETLGQKSVQFRWLVVALWLGLIIAVTFLPSLSSVVQTQNSNFLPSSTPSVKATNLAKPLESVNGTSLLVIGKSLGNQPLNLQDLNTIHNLETDIKKLPLVRSIHQMAISPNRNAMIIKVVANFGKMNIAAATALNQAVLQQLSQTNHTPSDQPDIKRPSDVNFYLAGPLATEVAQQSQSTTTSNRAELFSILFILILLMLVFQSVLAPFLTLIPAFIVLYTVTPIIAELAQHNILQISSLTEILLIVLILGAGTDYGLFLVFRVREELRKGAQTKAAVQIALSRVGESITFSAATVIAAMLSLLLASFGIYHDLGVPLAIGIVLMLLAGTTLTPALLSIFGKATFWPRVVRQGPPKHGYWGRIATWIIKRPVMALVCGIVIVAGLSFGILGNKAAGLGTSSLVAPPGSDAAKGNAVLAADFPTTSINPTNIIFKFSKSVWVNPSVIEKVQNGIGRVPKLFTNPVGPLNPIGKFISTSTLLALHARLGPAARLPIIPPTLLDKTGSSDGSVGSLRTVKAEQNALFLYESYRATSSFIATGGHTIQVEVALTSGDPSSTAAVQDIPKIRNAVTHIAKQAGATASGVAGEAPALYDVSAISSSDLLHIIPILLIVLGLILMLLLRSLVAPLYLLASVALSYLAALGLSVIIFIYILGFNGLTFFLPFLMFLFILALGEDYNILMMTRIREESHNLPLTKAVTKAVSATGSTITSAGLILAGTFGVLVVAGAGANNSHQVQALGAGLALGILMDTFLIRTLLVPSTVILLGKANWWPASTMMASHDILSDKSRDIPHDTRSHLLNRESHKDHEPA